MRILDQNSFHYLKYLYMSGAVQKDIKWTEYCGETKNHCNHLTL
jgi:hypothetical protein